MITLRRIRNAADPDLEGLLALYVEAFPEEERRDVKQLLRMLADVEEMHFCAIFHEDLLSGLAVYWDMGSFYYMEHLAVFPSMRNKQIGRQVLQWWRENLGKPQLLEVEPPVNEMSQRRISFYRRNGMEVLATDYIQPDYRADKAGIPLWVMGTEEPPMLAGCIRKIQDVAYRDALKYL